MSTLAELKRNNLRFLFITLLSVSFSTGLTGCLMDGSMIGSTLSPTSNGSGSNSGSGSNTGTTGNTTPIYQLVFDAPLNQPLQLAAGQDITPSVQVSVLDQNGELATSVNFTISLAAYSDSACTQLATDSGTSVSSATTQAGVATFTNIGTTYAGVYYIQASTQGALSACSPSLTITPGSPNHLDIVGSQNNNSNPSPQISASAGSSTSISVQVVDAYGNPVQPSSPVAVSFSVFYSGATPPGVISPSLATTNSSGVATANFTFNTNVTALMGLVSASSTGLPVSSPLLVPILLQPGPIHSFSVTGYPTTVLAGSSHFALVTAQDSNGNVVTSYSNTGGSTVRLSGSDGASTSVEFQPSDQGSKIIPLALPSPAPSPTPTPTPTQIVLSATDGSVSGSQSSTVTVFNPSCTTPSTWTDAGETGNWSSTSNWSNSTSPTLTSSSGVVFNAGPACTLDESLSPGVGCVTINSGGALNIGASSSTGLVITGSELLVNSGGTLTDSGEGVSFSPGSGVGPQIFSIGSSINPSNPNLSNLKYSPASTSGSLFIEGGSVSVENFALSAAYTSVVRIRNNVTVTSPLIIPNLLTVVITSGSSLTALGGLTIQGGATLDVEAGGSLYIGAGQTLDVQYASGLAGTLNLQGLASSGNQAVVSVAPSAPSGSTFAFTIESSAVFQATHFFISNTDINGVNFKPSSIIQSMNFGSFSNIATGGTAITLAGGISLPAVPYFYNLSFIDDLTRNGILAINAPTLTTQIGIIQSSFGIAGGGSQVDIKTRVYDPNSMLLWDH